jgi:hypothetical protein
MAVMAFWLPWRFTKWRTWPLWFRILWPLELATVVALATYLGLR